MSGHGGFIPVGNNMPINTINTSNVGNIQPQENVNLQPLNVEGEEQLPAEQEKVNPGKLAKQLDVLLLQAGKLSTKGVDATALKEQVSDLGLSKKELKTLNTLIDNAANTLNALDKFTGRELATATTLEIDKGGKYIQVWDKENPEGKALQAALDAQAALSEKLFELISSKGISREAKGVLEAAAMKCDCRACEIGTLVMQFSDAVSKMRLNDLNTLPQEVRERLDTKVFTLMGEKAITMHGNAEALAQMEEKLAPLAKRLDDFARNPDKSITSDAFKSMRLELNDAKMAFETLARNGYKVGDSRVMPDKAFMDAAKEILAQIEKRMENARKKLTQAALKSYIDSLFAPPPNLKLLDPKFRSLLKLLSSHAVKLAIDMDDVLSAARSYADDPTPQNHLVLEDAIAAYNQNGMATGAEMIANRLFAKAELFLMTDDAVLNAKIAKLPQNVRDKITPELIMEFKKAVKEFTTGALPKNAFYNFFKNGHNYKTQFAHLDDMFKTIERMGDEDFMTSKTFLSAFNGELAPSTLVEARVHGMLDEDVDPATDQSNVQGSELLGSGAMNTVIAVKFKNDETKVFKPEAPGRESLTHAVYAKEGYAQNQQIAQLNMASQKTADVLGLNDVMVKTSVGKFNGQYGIFMEKAPGTQTPYFVKNQRIGKNSLSCSQVQTLSKEEHAKVQGQIMRKCNRIDWMDAITGQGDRHNANIFLNVNKKKEVDVKCIDNDTCYPSFRIGMNKYIVTGNHLANFNQTIKNVSLLYGSNNQEKAMERLLKDPGVTKNKDGSYTLDASKFKIPELNYCLMFTFGMFSNYTPKVIDKDLYDHLQTLKVGSPQRDAYLADLKKRLSPAAFDAAVQRLDDAIQRADELAAKNMVYTEDDWNDRDKQKAIYNDLDDQMPRLEKQFNKMPDKTLPCYNDIQNGIYQMTQGNYKRNGFDLTAKIGWFK